MKIYLISYDLTIPESSLDYERLIKTIQDSFEYWAKPLKSLWLIKTAQPRDEVMRVLRTVTDPNDKILVIEVTSDWIAFNINSEVIEWMRGNII